MKALGRVHRPLNGDIRGQAGVDRQGEPLRRDAAVRAEIGAVAQGVNPGVRPAAADGLKR